MSPVNRGRMNWAINIMLTVSFSLLLLTGIIRFPGLLNSLGIPRGYMAIPGLSTVHDYSGLAMVSLGLVHIWLNRKLLLRRPE